MDPELAGRHWPGWGATHSRRRSPVDTCRLIKLGHDGSSFGVMQCFDGRAGLVGIEAWSVKLAGTDVDDDGAVSVPVGTSQLDKPPKGPKAGSSSKTGHVAGWSMTAVLGRHDSLDRLA